MQRLHKIISKMPMVMLLFWLFCVLFFVENKVYIDNFEIFDFIDTFIVILLAPHFIFFMKYYSQQSILSLKFMYLIVLLNLFYIFLNDDLYYFLYYIIILTYLVLSLWKITIINKK